MKYLYKLLVKVLNELQLEMKLENKYTPIYQTLLMDTPGSLGIFFYAGVSDLFDISKKVIYETYNVTFELVCSEGTSNIWEDESFLRNLVKKIENEFLRSEDVVITSAIRLGPAVRNIGTNEHGYDVLVSNLEIKYKYRRE